MIYLVVVLAIFLFYKFVPRDHKILVGKIGGVLVLLGVIIIGAFLWHDNWRSEQRKTWMSAEIVDVILNSDGKSTISVKICNNREKPLLKYGIYASGYYTDRSTKYKVIKDFGSDEGYTELKGDIIIAAKNCQILTWSVALKTFDKYAAWAAPNYWNEWENED